MAATKIGDITLAKKIGTILTLNQKHKYVDNDGYFSIDVQSGAGAVTISSADADVQSDVSGRNISDAIGQKSSTAPATGLYLKIQASSTGESTITTAGWLDTGSLGTATGTADKYFPVDAGEAVITGTNIVTPSASISGSNITLSNTDNGISITATGGGSAAASVTATVSQAGFVANNQSLDTETIAGSSQTTSASSFISGVTIAAPASGTRSFSVTVPNGNTTQTVTFTVDANGNVQVD